MSKDKKSKKHDKHKFDAKSVGKKVKAGSKGEAPDEEALMAEIAERVAAKRAAREAEAATEKPKKGKPPLPTGDAAEPIKGKKGKKSKKPYSEPKAEKPGAIQVDDADSTDDMTIEPDDGAEVVETEKGREFRVGAPKIDGAHLQHLQEIRKAAEVVNDPKADKKAKKKAQAFLDKSKAETAARQASGEDTTTVVEKPVTADETFATPNGKPDFERHGKTGRPSVLPKDGEKKIAYSRVTTWIDKLEDKTALGDWYKRVVLAGAAASDELLDEARAAEKAFQKAVKGIEKRAVGDAEADLYGPGEKEIALETAEKELKTKLNELAERAFELGEGRVKAARGTRLHWLTELVDQNLELPDDVTAEELDDLNAYKAAIKTAGLTIKGVEERIANDKYGIAGTTDRRYGYRRPGAQRAITVIGDLKTGRIDFGAIKIASQLAAYAGGELYNPTTDERAPLGVSQAVALLVHLPAGKATCTIYEVDLVKGRAALDLVQKVGEMRNLGNRKNGLWHSLAELEEIDTKAKEAAAVEAAAKKAEAAAAPITEAEVEEAAAEEAPAKKKGGKK